MLKIDHWILSLRSESFDLFFSYFPLLASEYFYISLIAIGYWVYSNRLNFISLTFLVPYSTLLNVLLKNIFQIPRPHTDWHLVPVQDPFGFPSGDVQVATVFWYYIFLNSKNHWKYLSFIPIIGIAISRIYLGVHCFYDVICGLIVGLATVLIWIHYLEKRLYNRSYTLYWILLIGTIAIFFFFSRGLNLSPMVSMACGALIGFGIFLPYAHHTVDQKIGIIRAFFYLSLIILLFKITPLIKTNTLTTHLSIGIKFAFLVYLIYAIPQINQILFQKKH